MKILIVNRFFGGAQIPTGRMAEDVARVLVEQGHEVVALASSGTYAGAVAQALDYRTTGRQDDPPTRSPLQPAPAGQGALIVETVRVPKWMPRALAWVWFTWQARKRIPRLNWDVCVLMTDPPLLPLLAKRAKAAEGLRDGGTTGPWDTKRRALQLAEPTGRRVAVWLMDLYPEALAASGRITKSNPLYNWYFDKRQRALGAADLLICLGEAQKKRLETERQPEVGGRRPQTGDGLQSNQLTKDQEQGQGAQLTQRVRTAVVPPWDDRGNIALATEGSLKNLVLYAGNLGEAHCFEEILAAAAYLPADWTIRFAARGAKLGALRAKASHREFSHSRVFETAEGKLTQINTDGVRAAAPTGLRGSAHAGGPPALAVSPPSEETKRQEARVEVTGYASDEETSGLLASARVHLITMSPGWEGIVVPSKLYGCIRTGRPVLFVGPDNADTAREIRAHDWGKVLPPGASGEEVAAAILELASRPTRAPQLQHGAGEIAALLVATAGLQDNGLTGQPE